MNKDTSQLSDQDILQLFCSLEKIAQNRLEKGSCLFLGIRPTRNPDTQLLYEAIKEGSIEKLTTLKEKIDGELTSKNKLG